MLSLVCRRLSKALPDTLKKSKLNLELNLRPQVADHLEIDLPFSKSIWIRSSFINALQGINTRLDTSGQADDVSLFERAIDAVQDQYHFDNAGTPFRFFLAYKALRGDQCTLDGSPRLRQRPMTSLVKALRDLGAEIECLEEEGFAPIRIKSGVESGGSIEMDSSESSQPISALLQIAPYLEGGLEIQLIGTQVSWSYVEQTINLMTAAGAEVEVAGTSIRVKEQPYQHSMNALERDWSSASYWYQFMALRKSGSIFFPQLHTNGLQGDEVLLEFYKNLGVETVVSQAGILIRKVPSHDEHEPLSFDLSSCPDLGPALMCTFGALRKSARFKGIAHLRLKESDRIKTIAEQMHLLGCTLEYDGSDEVRLRRSEPTEKENFVFDSFGDHRIAMALAACIPLTGNSKILNAEVVKKSYPKYWDHLNDFAEIKEW